MDDEMEKVFSMSGNVSEERFDVAKLHGTPESANTPRQYGERDYSRKYANHIHRSTIRRLSTRDGIIK